MGPHGFCKSSSQSKCHYVGLINTVFGWRTHKAVLVLVSFRANLRCVHPPRERSTAPRMDGVDDVQPVTGQVHGLHASVGVQDLELASAGSGSSHRLPTPVAFEIACGVQPRRAPTAPSTRRGSASPSWPTTPSASPWQSSRRMPAVSLVASSRCPQSCRARDLSACTRREMS